MIMARVMPSQLVQTIDELFPHAAKNSPGASMMPGNGSKLLGILNLLKNVPEELMTMAPTEYADLVLAQSTIEETLEHWRARGNVGEMDRVKGCDVVTVMRRALAQCPDEFPPPATTELLFIKDVQLRDSIRHDLGAANRALNNAEWKAATVLSGAAIEALLHWRLQEPSPGPAAVQAGVATLVSSGAMTRPDNNIDNWGLSHFIEVAAHLVLLKPDTRSAAKLAQNFRNLSHPGRAARLAQTCDRATALSAVGALEHVIRDLTP
jgi:hypothetical protein